MNIARHKTLVEAKIEGLVYCPFCNIPYEIDKCGRISEFPTIRLSHPYVILHVCNTRSEVEKKSETVLRRAVEERMKNSVIRERYNICQAGLIKTSGCNKVRFTIGYIDSIVFGSLSHFGICARHSGAPGKPCQSLKELGKRKSELFDVEIGPPLKKLRRQHPTYATFASIRNSTSATICSAISVL